jgi:hypothetical protein
LDNGGDGGSDELGLELAACTDACKDEVTVYGGRETIAS